MQAAKMSSFTPFSSRSDAISPRPEYFATVNGPEPLSPWSLNSPLSDAIIVFTRSRSPAQMASKNSLLMKSRLNLEYLLSFCDFPIQMVDIEQQHGLRTGVLELIVGLLLPAFRQIFRAVDVFREEAVFIGNSQVIQ